MVINPATGSDHSKTWAWMALLSLLIVGAVFWFFTRSEERLQPPVPASQSKDWTVEPQGPAVPVNLPKTRMTNAPSSSETP